MKTNKDNKQNLFWLAESALMIAAAIVLSEFVKFSLPFGGSVTAFGQVPILLICYRYGMKKGLLTSLAFGMAELLFGLSNFSYVKTVPQVLAVALLDYLIAFAALSLAGLFRDRLGKSPSKRSQVAELCCGSLLAMLVRFLCHFLSGITVWKGYASADFFESFGFLHGFALKLSPQALVIFYSLCYNLSYLLPETLMSIAALAVLGSLLDFRKQNLR